MHAVHPVHLSVRPSVPCLCRLLNVLTPLFGCVAAATAGSVK